MGDQYPSVALMKLDEVPMRGEFRKAVEQRLMKDRSDYSLREQSLTFSLAADFVSDVHLQNEMRAAAEIVGSQTYVDLLQYLMADESTDSGCLALWLDGLWNANVSNVIVRSESHLLAGH